MTPTRDARPAWSRYALAALDQADGDPRRRERWCGERGAGAALALAIATAALLLAMLVVGAGTASIAQARTAAAADAAALAAADALAGFADGAPCALAQAVATASGARLDGCALRGLEASVTTAVPVGPWEASATAIAGPPTGAHLDCVCTVSIRGLSATTTPRKQ